MESDYKTKIEILEKKILKKIVDKMLLMELT
jgi:hypothetical protein